MWPQKVKDEVLSLCGRRCCICRKLCRTNIELHHIVQEADGGESTIENCIPLCFDCHAEAGHYNLRHPKGTKFQSSELQKHRDAWFMAFRSYVDASEGAPPLKEIFVEGDMCEIEGYMWREGPPDSWNDPAPPRVRGVRYWIVNTDSPIKFRFLSMEDESVIESQISRIQLLVDSDFYDHHRELLNSRVVCVGKLFISTTSFHIGDALIEVDSLLKSESVR